MSKTYKTVIHLSSAAERPRERTGSDPLAYGAAKLRKDSSPSGSKHVSAGLAVALHRSIRRSKYVHVHYAACVD